jgi:hypothetical protein
MTGWLIDTIEQKLEFGAIARAWVDFSDCLEDKGIVAASLFVL